MILFGNQQNRSNDLIIQVAGKTSGTATAGTLVFSATEDISTKISAIGSASFSVVIANDSIYKLHTITLNCPNNQSGSLIIGSKSKIVSLGNHIGSLNPNVNLYAGTDATMPTIALNLNDLPQSIVKIRQTTSLNSFIATGNKALPTKLTYLYLNGVNINWAYSGALPTGLTYLYLNGVNINWTYSGALPTGLTYLYLYGNSINWTYTGALPTGLTLLQLYGNSINWTYTGALPTGLTYLNLIGNSINWTYTGALPTGLTILQLIGNSINWTYSGALPTGLTYLNLIGTNINWTYNLILGSATFTTFTLTNYRISKMSNADAITLIDSLRTKTGNLPATCTLNDLENPTDAGVVAARDALLAAGKGVTTFNLGG